MEALTVDSTQKCVDEVLGEASTLEALQQQGYKLRRATSDTELRALLKFVSTDADSLLHPIPHYFGLGLYRDDDGQELCGVVTAYIAYSTWDGRFLFVDELSFPGKSSDHAAEKLLLRTLAKVAIKLDCARLTWKHTEAPEWYADNTNPVEILHEWLIEVMDQEAMISYVGDADSTKVESGSTGEFSRSSVEKTVRDCLAKVNAIPGGKFNLRMASGQNDVKSIARLVHELAVFEKEPDGVNVTADTYACDGYSTEPIFYCVMLEDANNCKDGEDPHVCGMALFYFGYILGKGRFLYLEDLYIEDSYRKFGGGSLVMKMLARVGLALNCTEFHWVVLDWNTPAVNLYAKIGAKVQKGVKLARFCHEPLKQFSTG